MAEAAALQAPPAATLPPNRARQAAKLLAYLLIFLASLLVFLLLKLPDSLVANSVLNTLNNQTPFYWRADELRVRPLLLPHLDATKLTMESKAQSMPPVTFDTMKVYPSLLSLLPLTGSVKPKVAFEGTAYDASMAGSYRAGNDVSLNLLAENVNLAKLKPLTEQGIDLQGLITKLTADLDLANNDPSKADGTVELTGKNFVFDPAILPMPIGLPVMDLGAVDVHAKISNGKVELERFQVGSAGKDLELRVTGDIRLARNVAFSTASLRVVMKPSAKVIAAMPSLKQLLDTLATPKPDGYYAMRFNGTLANLGLPRPDK